MQRFAGVDTALSRARDVKRATGKPILHQLMEMLRLRLRNGKLMPNEYFDFELYDDRRFDTDAKHRFIGQWAKNAVYRVNQGAWRATGDDKLITYLLLSALGAPYPKVLAVYHPTRSYPARLLRNSGDLESYLRSDAPYPLFAKPAGGSLAQSAYLVRELDAAADRLLLGDGRSINISDFVEDCTRSTAGTIFQELIVPHPAVVELCGPRVATMRLYVLNGSRGAALHRAVLRLPAGNNMYDNFKGGRSGNLLVALDDEGRIIRAIGKVSDRLGEVDRHPDTGMPILGWQVPDWAAATSTCLATAAAFPGLRIQAWDVALAPPRPTLVEMNTHGDLDLIQIAHRVGIADERWSATLAA